VAIFDEAHILEDVATGWFGRSIDTADLARLADQAVAFMEGGGPHESQELALLFFNEQAELPDLFEAHYAEDLIYPADSRRGAGGEEIRRRLLSLAELARGLRHRIPKPAEGDDQDEAADLGDILKSRLGKLTEAATLIGKADDEGFVYQVEKKPRHNVALSAIPIEAGRILGRKLLEANRPVIMTSATLSAGGDFTYIRRRLGLDDENISEMSAVEDAPAPLPMSFLSIDSPYDYARDTVLYVPAPPFPGPDSDAFALEMPALIERLLGISGGRAMALFTSNRSLNSTASLMRRRKWPFRLLVQDEGSDRAALLRDFRDDVTSVLLATASFWQGVDVPGESLSVVVIDRLPFPRPNSPIFDARSRAVEEAGGSSFNDFSVPQMIISLRQGLGRLLRTSTDRGVLAILDNRLITKGYGRKIRRMLPPSPLTTDLAEVESFMKGGPPPKADPPPPKGTGRGAGRSRRRA
jgi:ATP-dependent DNA helicase DinG